MRRNSRQVGQWDTGPRAVPRSYHYVRADAPLSHLAAVDFVDPPDGAGRLLVR